MTDLAAIQYVGLSGITSTCIAAISCLINGGVLIEEAFLITCKCDHAFLLRDNYQNTIAVKDGFSSGYSGEGPRGLASALMLFQRHQIEINEHHVEPAVMQRLQYSCLLQTDVITIIEGKPVRPHRWYDYIYPYEEASALKQLSHLYPSAVPFGLIDERIADLAADFHKNSDIAIISAYRRLEDVLRKRTGLTGESTKLFSKAFLSDDAPLRWDVPDEGESKGRANLFIATFMAFRNARTHREPNSQSNGELREFLLVNELFLLEAEAGTEKEIKIKKAERELDSQLFESIEKSVRRKFN